MKTPFSKSVIQVPVYHGTDTRFSKFETGIESSRAIMFSEFKVTSQGIFFSTSPSDAKSYGSNLVKCWINLSNPLFSPIGYDGGRFSTAKEKDFVEIFSPLATDTMIEDGDRYPAIPTMTGQIKVEDVRFSSKTTETYPAWVYDLIDSGGIIWDVMDDPGVIQRMKNLGYDGSFVHEPADESGSSIFVLSPNQIQIIEWGEDDEVQLEEYKQQVKRIVKKYIREQLERTQVQRAGGGRQPPTKQSSADLEQMLAGLQASFAEMDKRKLEQSKRDPSFRNNLNQIGNLVDELQKMLAPLQ